MIISLIAPPLMDYDHNGILAPVSMDAARTCPPYGIYMLASVLTQAGHTVLVIDLIARGANNLDGYWHLLLSSRLIGIGTSSLSWPSAKQCVEEIRRYSPHIPIVLGGIHATMFDDYVLHTTGADYVIRGEAEKALPMLCKAIESQGNLRDVPNLTLKLMSGKIVKNPAAAKLTAEEIGRFPLPDYSQMPAGVYAGVGLESSRGCPFDCAFCSTSYRKTWRGLSADLFVDRLACILPHAGMTTKGLVQIIDDEFSVKVPRALEIFTALGTRGLTPRLVYSVRARDLLSEPFLEAAVPYTHQFLVGAECGYDHGLQKIGKGSTTEILEKAAALLQKHGLAQRADYSFIIGLPWETKAQTLQTVHFAFHLYSTYGVRVLLQWYCQIPGSRLWQAQRSKGVLHEAHYDDYGFFRDHYLFRSGISLTPSEVHTVHETIISMQAESVKNINGMDMILSSVPEPILRLYPKIPGKEATPGLANLREVAGVAQ